MQRILAGSLALLMVLGAAPPGWMGSSIPLPPTDSPAPADPEADAGAQETTPPRVSYLHGEVSFWRPGAADWAPAALNMPLAPGDVLYAGPAGNVEIQIGPRAFARAPMAPRSVSTTRSPTSSSSVSRRATRPSIFASSRRPTRWSSTHLARPSRWSAPGTTTPRSPPPATEFPRA